MRYFITVSLLLVTTSLSASDKLHLNVELEHSGWKVSKSVDVRYSTPLVLASSTDEVIGVNRILKVEAIQKPNDMVEIRIQYLISKDGKKNIFQDARFTTKLGEPATISSEADEHNDKIAIRVSPDKIEGF